MLPQNASGVLGLQGGSKNVLKLQGAQGGLQSGAGVQLVQPAISGQKLNVPGTTFNSQPQGQVASVGGLVGDGGAAARAAAAQAAEAAQAAARAAGLRSEIIGNIQNIKSTYDSIFGTSQNTANEQNQTLLGNYGKAVQDVNDQATTGAEQIGAAYTARGVGDSSYAGNAVQNVKNEAGKQITSLGDELKNNQASLGQFVAQKGAEVQAQKAGLDAILSRLSETTDPGELASLRNTLRTRLTDLQAAAADVQSNQQYLSQLTSVSPVSQRIASLQTVIGNIVKGSASPELKRSIGMSFIQNSGLDDNTQKQLTAELNASIGSQQTVTTQPPVPAL